MSRDLQVFNFEEQEIRVVFINEKPWWIAKDVCDLLGYNINQNNTSRILQLHCKLKGITECNTLTPGGSQQVKIINEANLYRLIMQSKMEKAIEVQDWVVEEVMPTIRKTGSYTINNKLLELDAREQELKEKEIKLDYYLKVLKSATSYVDFKKQDKDVMKPWNSLIHSRYEKGSLVEQFKYNNGKIIWEKFYKEGALVSRIDYLIEKKDDTNKLSTT